MDASAYSLIVWSGCQFEAAVSLKQPVAACTAKNRARYLGVLLAVVAVEERQGLDLREGRERG